MALTNLAGISERLRYGPMGAWHGDLGKPQLLTLYFGRQCLVILCASK